MISASSLIQRCKPGGEVIYAETHENLCDVLNKKDRRIFLRAGYSVKEIIEVDGEVLNGTGEGFLYRRATGEYVGSGNRARQIFQWCFRKKKSRRTRW